MKRIVRFLQDDSGAVTVDWVVLTASIVAINVFAVWNLIEAGILFQSDYIDDKVDEARTGSY